MRKYFAKRKMTLVSSILAAPNGTQVAPNSELSHLCVMLFVQHRE
jgi:hypothetical protein